MGSDWQIRFVAETDAEALLEIYHPYASPTSTVSFEWEPPTLGEFRQRIRQVSETYPWLVAERNGELIGYAYASMHRARKAYQWAVETSAYVKRDWQKQGIANSLYQELLRILREQGYVVAYAVIALPNDASVRFHESFAFQHFGSFPAAGFKNETWIDVGWWRLELKKPEGSPREPIPFKLWRSHARNSQLAPRSTGREISVSEDKSRLDPKLVHEFLQRTPWAKHRTLETVHRSIANSLCFGAFAGEEFVGFARVVTDGCTFAYLCDVFVHESYRGRGISRRLLERILQHPDLIQYRRFVLATQNAHGLYAKYGFQPVNEKMFMELKNDFV